MEWINLWLSYRGIGSVFYILANAHNINIIMYVYGNTKVTPAVHGYHGNFVFYQWYFISGILSVVALS